MFFVGNAALILPYLLLVGFIWIVSGNSLAVVLPADEAPSVSQQIEKEHTTFIVKTLPGTECILTIRAAYTHVFRLAGHTFPLTEFRLPAIPLLRRGAGRAPPVSSR